MNNIQYSLNAIYSFLFDSYRELIPSSTNALIPGADVAFKVLLSARFCSAIWSYIADCDETFNYWEPMHYLVYDHGLQTWEYSPQFALRSYTYLLFHCVPAWLYKAIFQPNPMLIFYFVRCLLGLTCAIFECYFYKYEFESIILFLFFGNLLINHNIFIFQGCLS